ncbi:MAG: acyl-CoA dehydrogenase family protein [Gammaproteobacteria bacterium]
MTPRADMEVHAGQDDGALVASAQALRPVLRAEAAEIERTRRLTPAALAALREMRAFNLQLARTYGGPEADPPTYLRVLEELARGDASAAWCAMVGAESSGCINAWLAPATVRHMLADPYRSAAAVTVVGSGRAVAVPGGYRVTGHWRFASNCRHADWLGALCTLYDGETPRLRENGAPQTRMMFAPVAETELRDTWHTSGLCGTASDDFAWHDVFVPEAHGADLFGAARDPAPAWRIPVSLRFAMSKAAVCCGIARSALDALQPLLDRTPFTGARAAREEPRVHVALAEAEAALEGGRAFLYRNIARAWERVVGDGELDQPAVAAVRLAIVSAARGALEATRIAQELGGAAGIFDPLLDRAGRDLNVARHHVQLQAHVLEDVGRVMLGLAPRNPLF